MSATHSLAFRRFALRTATLVPVAVALAMPVQIGGQSSGAPMVTFTRDIAPILQRSCQQCHREDGGAPMSLITYQDVRPWARAMKLKTGLGPRAGVMPPWFVEKDIGIQGFKSDPSLSPEEIGKIAAWADNGAPQGNPADLPAPRAFVGGDEWTIGEPDLILRSKEVSMAAAAADWWGDVGRVPTGLTEDRYVSAVEVREINDIPKSGPVKTVGGRFVFHHMTYSSVLPGEADAGEEGGESWPIHEVGRNADVFPPEAGRLLAAHSSLALTAAHLHANGHATKAHLEFGFKFYPTGYKPLYKRAKLRLGNGADVDLLANQGGQVLHSYAVLQEHTKIVAFEPHLHAPGTRMCLEAIWGGNMLTLSCVGYDHNWVKQYVYKDDTAPLLPKGTIVHLMAFLDTTATNKNVVDPRNWTGGGRRSVSNMFLDLGYSLALTEEQFQDEMAKRRAKMTSRNDFDLGCPLCWAPPVPTGSAVRSQGAQ